MTPVIPTVFATTKEEFNERLSKVSRLSRNLQIDFMDGKFVKTRSISLAELPHLNSTKNKFEAHLMVSNPEAWIHSLKEKGFEKVIFHVESTKKIEETIALVRSAGLIPYIALNPETPTEKVFPFLSKLKGVMFMGVTPGREHQSLDPKIFERIKLLRSVNKAVKIQVDGGVSDKNVVRLAKAGANYLNSGSYIAESDKPKEAYRLLVNSFKGAK